MILDRAQPAAIAKALATLWEYREDLRHREGKAEHVRDARKRLSEIIERLGGSPLLPSYDELPEPTLSKRATDQPSATVLQSLVDAFDALYNMPPQKRGFAFERFLTDVFNAWHLDARVSFRNPGEQIDGSFWYDGNAYLLEAKWHIDLIGATTLHGFEGKLRERHDFARGLFVSYSGFSPEGLQAFTARRVILMDGFDLYQMLMRDLPLGRVIDAKWRRAAERKEAFARVVELFPVDASG
jgi:hypothetical protein